MAKGRIPQSDIDAIRERAPIEEIVGDYVQLKPGGYDSLKGLSPFKDEKTPSFHVRPQRGYYHCFATGNGGDVFKFLMELEQLSFPEAVEAVAEKIGYTINYQGGSTGARDVKPGTRQRLIAANRAAHEFYRQQLETEEAAPARQFLLDRHFSQDMIYHFECGYAPGGWDTLTKYLLRKGFDVQELIDAGLSKMSSRGTPIDAFMRRLLWPIKDLANNVIGFGARKLFDDDRMGKYMNTKQTMLYDKSKVLFGLDLAKRNIADGHQAVIVEGYTDVMAMHAAGVTTAVASCGTAFGPDHLQVLRRIMLDDKHFRGEIIYTFDGDEAGQQAALRSFDTNKDFTGHSFVAVAPDGMDPCDLRMEKGDVAVRDLVANRIPMIEFVVESVIKDYPLDTVEGRLAALRRAVPVIAQVDDRVLRDQYAHILSGWVGWPNPEEVVNQVREEARKPRRRENFQRATRFDNREQQPSAQEPMFHAPNPRDPYLWPEREALKLALQFPQAAGDYFDGVGDDAYSNDAYRAVRVAVDKAGGAANAPNGPQWVADVAGEMADLAGRHLVSELAVEEIVAAVNDELDMHNYADSVLSRLQEQQVGNQIALLKAQMERMRPTDDEAAYNTMFADLVALEKTRRDLSDRAWR